MLFSNGQPNRPRRFIILGAVLILLGLLAAIAFP